MLGYDFLIEDEEKDNNTTNIECCIDIMQMYLSEIKLPLLTKEQEKELFVRYRNGDNKARDILIERNLKLVVFIAKKYHNCGVEMLDLIQEGNIGLIAAINKYDENYGTRFSTYATNWINSYIIKAINARKKVSETLKEVKKAMMIDYFE